MYKQWAEEYFEKFKTASEDEIIEDIHKIIYDPYEDKDILTWLIVIYSKVTSQMSEHETIRELTRLANQIKIIGTITKNHLATDIEQLNTQMEKLATIAEEAKRTCQHLRSMKEHNMKTIEQQAAKMVTLIKQLKTTRNTVDVVVQDEQVPDGKHFFRVLKCFDNFANKVYKGVWDRYKKFELAFITAIGVCPSEDVYSGVHELINATAKSPAEVKGIAADILEYLKFFNEENPCDITKAALDKAEELYQFCEENIKD